MAKRILRSVGKPANRPADLEARAHIALRATWQLSSILGAMTKIARDNEHEEMPVHAHLLALAMRAGELNTVISLALGDEIADVADLRERLNENDEAYIREVANG